MEITNTVFNTLLKEHKKSIFAAQTKLIVSLRNKINKSGRELAMFYAGFQCQGCKKEDDLTYHHLITKYNEQYTDEIRYFSMRNYWNNIFILCRLCHANLHGNKTEDLIPLGDTELKRIKKKFGWRSKEEVKVAGHKHCTCYLELKDLIGRH